MKNIDWKVLSFNELSKTELYELLQARCEVFVVEQKCQYQDMDNKDFVSYHVMGVDGDQVAAYCRVYMKGKSGSIGRLLVIKEYRRCGLAHELLTKALETLHDKFEMDQILISAQTYLIGFYQGRGFEVRGEEYMDAGMPHIDMVKSLM